MTVIRRTTSANDRLRIVLMRRFGWMVILTALAFHASAQIAVRAVVRIKPRERQTEQRQRIGAMRFAALAISAACLCCILQFLLLRPLSALALPKEVYGLMVIVAAVCTVIPIFLTAEALRRIGANQVAMIGAVGPVSAIVFGGIQLAGAALVIVGVLLATVGRRAAKAA